MLNNERVSEGLKKIYKGEILELISALLAVVAVLAAAITTVVFSTNITGGTIAAASFTLVATIATLVLAIISFIMIIMGLNKVGKDEKWCKYALILIIADIIVQIVLTVLGKSNYVSSASGLFNMLVMIMIIQGCMNLNEKINNPEMVKKGKSILYFIIVAMCISIITSFIVTINTKILVGTLVIIAGIVSIVCLIIAYIKFLKYLKNTAKAMLD